MINVYQKKENGATTMAFVNTQTQTVEDKEYQKSPDWTLYYSYDTTEDYTMDSVEQDA